METKYKRSRWTGEPSLHIRYPDSFKHQNKCVFCSVVFGAKRWNARTCSSQCRQAEYRYQRKLRRLKEKEVSREKSSVLTVL